MKGNFIQKTFWGWVLLGAITSATLFALVVVSFTYNNGTRDYNQSISQDGDNIQNSRAAEENILVSEAVDWKTYRNEKFGFEIDYPNDWTIEEASKDPAWVEWVGKGKAGDVPEEELRFIVNGKSSHVVQFGIEKNSSNSNAATYLAKTVKSAGDGKNIAIEEFLSANNIKGYKLSGFSFANPGITLDFIAFSNAKNIFIISFLNAGANNELPIDVRAANEVGLKMASSFKFTK